VEDISFETIRDALNSGESTRIRSDDQKRLIEEFRTKPFEELKTRVNEKQRQADQRIGQLLNVLQLSKDSLPTATTTNGNLPNLLSPASSEKSKIHTNNFNYPELFTY